MRLHATTRLRRLVAAAVVVAATPRDVSAQVRNDLGPGEFLVDPPTLHCLGLRWYVDGDDNGNATAAVSYRRAGDGEWLPALPMLRVNREVVDRDHGKYVCGNLFAGSILRLAPATQYEVRVRLADPDGGSAEQSVPVTTRAIPGPPEALRTLHVYAPTFDGVRRQPSFDDLSKALGQAAPGDRVLLSPGIHKGNAMLRVAGTGAAPIVISGASRDATIIAGSDGDGRGAALDVTGSHHLFIENLTIRGGRFGIYTGNKNQPDGTRDLVVRNCRIDDVETGIYAYSPGSANWFIADNLIVGRNPAWFPRDAQKVSHTGINFYGRGHIVCRNRIEKFWDCLAIANYGHPPRERDMACGAIDMYGNDLSQALDDCIETDYASHNVRVWGNRLMNAHVGVSCQPVYGGPVYILRNEMVNCTYTAFKLHNWPSGLYILHNTSVLPGQGFRSDEIWQNAVVRNNLFLGHRRYAMETGSPHRRTTLDYNGYRKTDDPLRFIKWKDWQGRYERYATLAELAKGTGHEAHGIMVDYDGFVSCPVPVEAQSADPEVYDLALRPGAPAVDAGEYLPNINDGFTGPAPDIGCRESAATPPMYGPQQVEAGHR